MDYVKSSYKDAVEHDYRRDKITFGVPTHGKGNRAAQMNYMIHLFASKDATDACSTV
jgi:hypothetical protein